MSDQTLNHPQRQQLLEYGLGKLDPDKSDLIELHLAECDQCGETLLNLQDDTFVKLIRRSDALETPTENSEPNRAEDRPQASVMGETLVEGSAASEGELDLPESLADHPRYRIVDLLGKGGMGDVYQAEHIVMNRPVALKIINRELVKKSQAVERFRREVHAAARLSHPNIVTAHDAEQAGDLHFLVMEFVDGIDLSRLVKDRGALPVHEACDYARQAALGLQHAHEQGMVHRDIKPHNLMVTADGTVKILDFGLAGFATETALMEAEESEGAGSDSIPLHLTAVGSVMGTPDYIAPEQACDAHSADIRADVYSLGCTLYFLLTGQPPHNATTVIEKLQAHAEHEPPAIESIRADVPDELAEVIRRMMAKDPQDRFQTPQEVADALAPFVDAHRSNGDFPQPGVRADDGSRWSKPDRFAIAMACLTACCLLLAQIGLNFVQLGVVWIVGMFAGLGIASGMKSDPPPRRLSSTGWFAWGASVVLAGIIFFVKTDYGTIRVELNDPDTTITIDDDMSINFRNAQDQLLTIRAGAHKLTIKQGETEFETETFRIRRNDVLVLSVELVGNQLQAELEKLDELGSKRMIGRSQSKQIPNQSDERIAEVGRFTRHAGYVYHTIVSPDGKFGISCGEDKTIRIWDLATQEELRVLEGHEGSVFGLAVSPDGKILASSDKARTIRLWNLVSGESLGELNGHEGDVSDLAFLPDGRLLSAGFDETLRLWNIDQKKLLRTIDLGAKVEKMEPLWDNQHVMLSGAHTGGWGVITYDLEKGEKLDPQASAQSCLAVASDRRTTLIGSISGLLKVYDKESGKLIVQMADPRAKAARDAAILPNSRFAITTTRDGQMHLWNLEEGERISTVESESIGTVTLSPNGKYALTTGREAGISVWRLPELVRSKTRNSTPAATRERFEEMIAATRAAETDEELQGVVAGYTPMLSLLSQDAGGDLIELLAELPDEMHEALLLDGYLKWKADELDEIRQRVMLDMFAAVLSQAPNTESTRKKLEQLDAYANVSDVGFAVIGLPESDSQVLVWYFLRRDVKFPTVLMLSGNSSLALQEALRPKNHQQINQETADLLKKPYSDLPPTPTALPQTAAQLNALIEIIPREDSDEEWKTFLGQHSPPIVDFPVEFLRKPLQLIAGLPAATRQELLDRGYLKWRLSELDEERRELNRELIKEMLESAMKSSSLDDQTIEKLIERRQASGDVGFVVATVPTTNSQIIVWYMQNPDSPPIPIPMMVPVLGVKAEFKDQALSKSVYRQVGGVDDKPYTELPPVPLASREIRKSLRSLLNNLPEGEVSDEVWIEYLSEYSPFMADPKAPQPLTRNHIRLLDSLPEDSIDSLLEQGFVKWPYSKLDKTRQERIRAIMQGVMSAVPPEHRGEKVADLIVSSLVTADVGFAVLKLPETEKQFVAFFAQMPTAFGPSILPVLGDLSDLEFNEINSPAVQEQIENIVKQPDSNLPASRRTTGLVPHSTIKPETKQAFHELIDAAREASTDEEWAQVLAKHAPTLALTEESETEQFGKAEMALMREGGRILIELLGGLPDAVHNDLLQSGYLKWSFKDLDEPRREAMQAALKNVLSASDKMGFPAGLKDRVPEILASGDVGFAVAETPKGETLLWYLLIPESPIPMFFPLFGTPHEGEAKDVSLTRSVYKQIGDLENKPYSELLTLLKATDMQRLQGVWTFVRGEANGKPSTPRTLEIAANVWLLKDPQTGRTIQRMTFDIDPTQNPRHITVTSADFPQPMKGIYQFDGDELHITSASAPGGERPTEFDQGGAGKFFVVMRREPPPDQKRISMEQTLERLQKERDASQEISFAVWEADGKAVLRFANWLLVFEGIDAAPGLGGFSSFRVPHERYDDSQREGGGVTFGTDDSSLKLTIDQRIIDGVGHITVNDFRFRMEGRAEKLLFESETYSAGSDVQTIVIRASGKTKLLNAKTKISLLNFQWSLIPAGEFQMGTANQNVNALSPDKNWFFADFVPDRRRAETPQHRVSITKPFMMSKHEVAVGQFRQFVETTGYKTTAEIEGEGYGWKEAEWEEDAGFNWMNPGFEQSDDQPVCNVSWEDAVAFCRWLSSQDGQTYRLPTEAEWEYACRASTTTLFSTGDDPDSLQGFANLADATLRKQYANVDWAVDWEDGFAATSPVGSFKPNQFGLYDMHGNVWEWCQDVYDTEWYETSPQTNPLRKGSSGTHVFRGGGFDNWPGFLRSADRYSSHSPTLRSQWAGFRVVRELDEGRSQIPNL